MKKLLVSFAVLLSIGCSNKQENSLETSQTPNILAKTITCSPGNDNNSNDAVGAMHNACLDASSVYFDDNPFNIDLICNTIEEEMYNNYGFSISISSSDVDELSAAAIEDGISTFIDTTTEDGVIMNSIWKTLSSPTYQEGNSYCDAKSYILSIEGDVMENSNLSTEERNNVLVFTSTLRHSLYYWELNSSGDDGEMNAMNVAVGLIDAGAAVAFFFATDGSLGDRLKGAAAFGAGVSAMAAHFF